MKCKFWFYSLSLSILLALFLLAGCGDDDNSIPSAPSFTYESSVQPDIAGLINLAKGEGLIISMDISIPGGFKQASMKIQGIDSIVVTPADLSLDNKASSVSFSFDPVTIEVDGSIPLTIGVKDQLNQEATTTFEVQVKGNIALRYETVLIYVPSEEGDSETFFATNLGITASKNQVDSSEGITSNDIDFGYAVNALEKTFLASPANFPEFVGYSFEQWENLNVTTFKDTDLDLLAFNRLKSDDDLKTLFQESINASPLKEDISDGDVFSFQVDSSNGRKYGAIRIITVFDGNGNLLINDQGLDFVDVAIVIEK